MRAFFSRSLLASLGFIFAVAAPALAEAPPGARQRVEIALDARVGELHVTHYLPMAEILKAMPDPGADPLTVLQTYIADHFSIAEPFGQAELAFVSAERRGAEMVVRYRGNLTPPSRALTITDTMFAEIDPALPIHVSVRERLKAQNFDLTVAAPKRSVGFDAVSEEAF